MFVQAALRWSMIGGIAAGIAIFGFVIFDDGNSVVNKDDPSPYGATGP